MLQVFNTYDEIQFSRRFLVYEDLVGVQAAIKRSRTLAYLNSKQVLQFSVNTQNINLNQPAKELEIVLLKNYQWNTQISGIQPMFNNGNTLVYDYDQPTSFWGGNEYLNFDTKDMRAATAAIQEVRLEDIYEHYLYPNTPKPRSMKYLKYIANMRQWSVEKYPEFSGAFVLSFIRVAFYYSSMSRSWHI